MNTLSEATKSSPRTEWVAMNDQRELFGVDVIVDCLGRVIGHSVVKRNLRNELEVVTRYPAAAHPGRDTFGMARADAVLASSLPGGF